MSRVGLALVVLLVGCAHRGPSAWTISGNVTSEWASRAVVLSEEVRRVARPPEPWGGLVVVWPGRFPCSPWVGATGTCAGLSGATDRVEVAFTPDPLGGALAHELCHDALCRPFKRDGDNGCGEATADACAVVAVDLARERLDGASPGP